MNPFRSVFGTNSCPDLSLALPMDESHTRLFGVDLSKPPKKKSKSMIDLNTHPYSSRPSSSFDPNSHSDDGVPKKKRVSVRWTKEEHMRFLEGLQALGRREWAGITKDYVITKNTTQVTSHAQKHFLHQLKNAGKQHKGSSIFDLHPPPPQRQMNNVDNSTPVSIHIPFWMRIGPIGPLAIPVNPNMQLE